MKNESVQNGVQYCTKAYKTEEVQPLEWDVSHNNLPAKKLDSTMIDTDPVEFEEVQEVEEMQDDYYEDTNSMLYDVAECTWQIIRFILVILGKSAYWILYGIFSFIGHIVMSFIQGMSGGKRYVSDPDDNYYVPRKNKNIVINQNVYINEK